MSTTWLSTVLGVIQLLLWLTRYLERARIIAEADAQATARLLQSIKGATDVVTADMDRAAANAGSMSNDPFERP